MITDLTPGFIAAIAYLIVNIIFTYIVSKNILEAILASLIQLTYMCVFICVDYGFAYYDEMITLLLICTLLIMPLLNIIKNIVILVKSNRETVVKIVLSILSFIIGIVTYVILLQQFYESYQYIVANTNSTSILIINIISFVILIALYIRTITKNSTYIANISKISKGIRIDKDIEDIKDTLTTIKLVHDSMR